jgi:hypothetical protein
LEGPLWFSPLLGLVIFVLDIIAIVDVLKSKADAGNKLIWLLVILFLPVVGMILYFLMGRGAKV